MQPNTNGRKETIWTKQTTHTVQEKHWSKQGDSLNKVCNQPQQGRIMHRVLICHSTVSRATVACTMKLLKVLHALTHTSTRFQRVAFSYRVLATQHKSVLIPQTCHYQVKIRVHSALGRALLDRTTSNAERRQRGRPNKRAIDHLRFVSLA